VVTTTKAIEQPDQLDQQQRICFITPPNLQNTKPFQNLGSIPLMTMNEIKQINMSTATINPSVKWGM
jgi:hypothetical protein